MGTSQSSMEPGDQVVIGITDMDVIRQLQDDHGGWDDTMEECLVGPCLLIQDNGTDAHVQGPSGNMFQLNLQLLVKYSANGALVRDEWAVLTTDESQLKAALGGSWESSNRLDELRGLLGQCVKVRQRGPDGICTVTHNAKTYTLDRNSMNDSSSTHTQSIWVGDTVTLTSDKEMMKRLQHQHGGWSNLMELLLVGGRVQVLSVLEDGDLLVSSYGTHWLVNPHCVMDPLNSEQPEPDSLKPGDLVQISSDIGASKELQKKFGWIEPMESLAGMMGKIVDFVASGAARVNVGSVTLRYNPRLLTKIIDDKILSSHVDEDRMKVTHDKQSVITSQKGYGEMTITRSSLDGGLCFKLLGRVVQKDPESHGQSTGNASLSTYVKGDMVKVIDDKERVMTLQKDHGEWNKLMTYILGQRGTVKYILPNGDLGVKIWGKKVVLNSDCVVKVDPGTDDPQIGNEYLSKFEVGDRVKLIDDKQKVEALQEGHGEWDECMNIILGKKGKVKHISPSGDLCVKVKGNEIILNAECVVKSDVGGEEQPEAPEVSPLEQAVLTGDYVTCCKLIESGADVNSLNSTGMTPIMCAAQHGNQDILRRLLQHPDANLAIKDGDGDTALHLAVHKCKVGSVETLLRFGADIWAMNDSQFNAFHLAAQRGHRRILALILQQQGTYVVDLQKDDKFAAIHLAALNNHPDCLRLLTQYRADINIRTDKLQTALHIAVSQKNMECVKILVNSKAELNLRDERGYTPLHNAIRLHQIDYLKRICKQAGLGETVVLMGESEDGPDKPEDIALYLVKNGASLHILNRAGKSPLAECEDEDLKAKLERLQTIQVWAVPRKDPVLVTNFQNREIKELNRQIQMLEEEKMCTICRDKFFNVAFGCGHVTCSDCVKPNLLRCPMCRKDIIEKIKISML